MLLNLSNHPSSTWPENQLKAALNQYQAVEDLPFPKIPPEMAGHELDLLVEQYFSQIRKTDPMAVHLMGELTFTFRLVNKLKAIGIPCIASTTERKVTEKDNKKTSEFKFVQFRSY